MFPFHRSLLLFEGEKTVSKYSEDTSEVVNYFFVFNYCISSDVGVCYSVCSFWPFSFKSLVSIISIVMNDELSWFSWVLGVGFLPGLLKRFQNTLFHEWDGSLQAPYKEREGTMTHMFYFMVFRHRSSQQFTVPQILKWLGLALILEDFTYFFPPPQNFLLILFRAMMKSVT